MYFVPLTCVPGFVNETREKVMLVALQSSRSLLLWSVFYFNGLTSKYRGACANLCVYHLSSYPVYITCSAGVSVDPCCWGGLVFVVTFPLKTDESSEWLHQPHPEFLIHTRHCARHAGPVL